MNVYAEPLVSLGLDLVVAAEDLASAESVLRRQFKVERFPHSLNVTQPELRDRVPQ